MTLGNRRIAWNETNHRVRHRTMCIVDYLKSNVDEQTRKFFGVNAKRIYYELLSGKIGDIFMERRPFTSSNIFDIIGIEMDRMMIKKIVDESRIQERNL
jgi:hypothetical protein